MASRPGDPKPVRDHARRTRFSNSPASADASNGASTLPSWRSTSTFVAPGRKARITRPSATSCGPRTENGLSCSPSASARLDCRSRRQGLQPHVSHAASGSAFRDSRYQARQTRKRYADPGWTVGRFIGDFVSGLVEKEEIEKRPRSEVFFMQPSSPNSRAETQPMLAARSA